MKKKSLLIAGLFAMFTLMACTIILPNNVNVKADTVTATYDYSNDKYNRHWQYDNVNNIWNTYNVYDEELID